MTIESPSPMARESGTKSPSMLVTTALRSAEASCRRVVDSSTSVGISHGVDGSVLTAERADLKVVLARALMVSILVGAIEKASAPRRADANNSEAPNARFFIVFM